MYVFIEPGVKVLRYGDYIEQVSYNGNNVALISGGNGCEVIHHRLDKGVNWYIGPEDNWTGFEYLIILSGVLQLNSQTGSSLLHKNDSFAVTKANEVFQFTALEETEFVYFSSQPVFHHYSHRIRELSELTIAVENKDGNTSEHCKRIRTLSLLVGYELNLSPQEISRLHFGSFFHDVGKIKIPNAILRKPGRLTDDEYQIMKTHTELGKQILIDTGNPLLIESVPIVEQHHERFDGSGYPKGLQQDEILIESAIVAVVDSYDAMISNRIYKDAKPKQMAIEEIEYNRGKLYNPIVVDSFLKVVSQVK